MDTQLYQSLLASLQEAVAISNGTVKPARVIVRRKEELVQPPSSTAPQTRDVLSEVEQK